MKLRLVKINKDKPKGQAAVDFMVSYGIAILIITTALYVVLRLGIFNAGLSQPSCTSVESFSCGELVFSANGEVTFILTQALGGTVNVTAIACSSAVNDTGNGPQYGNVHILPYSALSSTVANSYYPSETAMKSGIKMNSDSAAILNAYCFGSGGTAATNLGDTFTGYIWLNYTLSDLPSNFYSVQRVIAFTAKAS